jgi:hypothetical protein
MLVSNVYQRPCAGTVTLMGQRCATLTAAPLAASACTAAGVVYISVTDLIGYNSGKQSSIFRYDDILHKYMSRMMGLNPCQGYGSQSCSIRIFLVRSGFLKKLWQFTAKVSEL